MIKKTYPLHNESRRVIECQSEHTRASYKKDELLYKASQDFLYNQLWRELFS